MNISLYNVLLEHGTKPLSTLHPQRGLALLVGPLAAHVFPHKFASHPRWLTGNLFRPLYQKIGAGWFNADGGGGEEGDKAWQSRGNHREGRERQSEI